MALRGYIIGIAAVAALAGAAAWYVWRPASVSTVAPSRGDAAEVVYASGVVEPHNWAKVAPVVRERIVEQCDCEGSRVAKGNVLARLDDTEVRALLAEIDARLDLAQEVYRRLSVLAEKNAASRQAVDEAQSELSRIQALKASQQAKLETYILRAPSDGIVLRQDGEVGEVAELGTVLFWVGEPKPLIVVADVNEEDIPRVEVGQHALLKSDAFAGRKLEATVYSITPKGDPVTKTYRVRFHLPDDTPLMIGMSTDVNIIIRVAKNALLIPSVAIERNSVFVVEGDKARRRELSTGIRGTNGVEVLSDLDETARVISPYPANLADGARVSIVGPQED